MKLRILCLGRVENASLRALCADYLGRLQRLNPAEVVELRDAPGRDAESRLAEEAGRLRKARQAGFGLITLSERGDEMDSLSLSRFLEKNRLASRKGLDFIIGSSHGLHPDLDSAADTRLALSRFTFTHETARFVLLEQLYRAFTLLRGLPYHH